MNVNKPIFTLVLIAILSTSCGKKSPENDPRFDGNRKMVQLLDSLSKAADPVVNFYLSAERAERMRTHQPAFKSQFEKLMWNKTYYNELLNAGKTEEAAVGFNFLLTDANYAPLLDKKMRNELEQMLAVSYLRSGELQNCVVNHTSQSCIVPIQKEGQHKIRTGSENAIRTYLSILETTPDDLNSHWLLNIAAMTLGEYPQAVPEKFRIPIATFEGKGNEGKFKDRAIDLGLDIDGLAGGSIIEDFNNDGSLDIFCTSYGLTDQCHLFFNNNKGGFEEVTESAQLMGITGGLNAKQADYDNDGWIDVYVGTGAFDFRTIVPNRMFRNVEGKYFEEVTMNGTGHLQKGHGIAFGDLDNDGDQDIYSVMGGAYDGDNAKNILFENPGPAGQWVSLSVDASTGNKAAYGSKLKLTLKMRDGSQRIVYSCINSGATFGANSLRQEIGLGDAVQIENVELLWALPGKKPLQFGSVPMNAHSTLVEKGLKVNTSKLEAHAFTATSASGHEHHHGR